MIALKGSIRGDKQRFRTKLLFCIWIINRERSYKKFVLSYENARQLVWMVQRRFIASDIFGKTDVGEVGVVECILRSVEIVLEIETNRLDKRTREQ